MPQAADAHVKKPCDLADGKSCSLSMLPSKRRARFFFAQNRVGNHADDNGERGARRRGKAHGKKRLRVHPRHQPHARHADEDNGCDIVQKRQPDFPQAQK